MDLNQVTIHTNRPVETAEFFQKLGLRIIVDSLPRYARFECPDGEATLSVHFADGAPAAHNIVLYFECDDLDATVSELEASGVVVAERPSDREWLWREAYVMDPNGNNICLYKAGENRKNPPWRVK